MWNLVLMKVIEVKGYDTYEIPHKRMNFLEDYGLVNTTVVVCE